MLGRNFETSYKGTPKWNTCGRLTVEPMDSLLGSNFTGSTVRSYSLTVKPYSRTLQVLL